jgi:hypothetical protein
MDSESLQNDEECSWPPALPAGPPKDHGRQFAVTAPRASACASAGAAALKISTAPAEFAERFLSEAEDEDLEAAWIDTPVTSLDVDTWSALWEAPEVPELKFPTMPHAEEAGTGPGLTRCGPLGELIVEMVTQQGSMAPPLSRPEQEIATWSISNAPRRKSRRVSFAEPVTDQSLELDC